MPSRPDPYVAGLVLAAGQSTRLGQPKQLLPYGHATLLDHTLNTARACNFDQLVCAIGGPIEEIRATVGLADVDVVENHSSGEGCSSSIALALAALEPETDVLVLLLGDQPGITPETVAALLAGRSNAPLAVCAYADGRGHPFAFSRSMFGELSQMHGDKAVWKLLDRHTAEVVEVPIAGTIPRDVDTWEDYDLVSRDAPASSRTGSGTSS